MSKFFASLFLSVGVGLVVVGSITAGYAFLGEQEYTSTEVWPFGGNWDSRWFFLISVAALSVGGWLVTFGLTWVRFLLQQGSSPFFTWRRVLLAVAIPIGVCFVLAGCFWLSSSNRSISQADRKTATEASMNFITVHDKVESHRLMTPEFRERTAAGKDQSYRFYFSRVQKIVPGKTELESWAHGYLRRTEKEIGKVPDIESQPRRVKFLLRLIRTPGGPWLVDDAQFTEEG